METMLSIFAVIGALLVTGDRGCRLMGFTIWCGTNLNFAILFASSHPPVSIMYVVFFLLACLGVWNNRA